MVLRKLMVVPTLALALFLLAGCSSVSEKVGEKAAEELIGQSTGVDVDVNGENVTLKSKDGQAELNIGGNKLPDSFPKDFPVYKNAKIEGSVQTQEAGNEGFTVNLTTPDKYTKVAQYYKEALSKGTYKIASIFESEPTVTLGLKKGEKEVGSIMIVGNDEGDTMVVITITK